MSSKKRDIDRPLIGKLRQLREDAGLLQSEVAEEIGVTRQTYQSYESGIKWIPDERVLALADLYGVSADYLLSE